jgi:hypothetical protein
MYYLSLCAIHRFEGPHLREWIEYHCLLGFEHFFLYANDDDSDEVRQALEPYLRRGLVDAFAISGRPCQVEAYAHCTRLARDRSRWVAFFDLDEFCYPLGCDSVPEILRDHESYGGLAINWCCYGTSGLRQRPRLVTGECVRRAPEDFQANRHVKTIADPRRVAGWDHPHFPRYLPGAYSVDENLRPVAGPFNAPPTLRKIRLNHYVLRSEENFALKQKRQRATRSDANGYGRDFFEAHDRNDILDPNRFAAQVRAALECHPGAAGG